MDYFWKKVIKWLNFNQNVWPKRGLWKKTQIFEKKMFYRIKLMNIAVFWKAIENVRKYRDIILVITEREVTYLV